jgi:hypothetical protein
MGQIGHSIYIRYEEHIRNIKYNKDDAGYTPHILNNIHHYEETEDMEKTDSAQGQIMDIKEDICIYK